MSSDKKAVAKPALKNGKTNEEIYAGFQTLRNEQRVMANKLTEMEAELNEHRLTNLLIIIALCSSLCGLSIYQSFILHFLLLFER